MTLSILLVDDHSLVRHGIASLLRSRPILDFCPRIFQASDSSEATKILEKERIDIVLVEILLPGMNGIDLCKRLKKIDSSIKIIGLSVLTEKTTILEFFSSGANGFLTKKASLEELIGAIIEVLNDRIYISPIISKYFIQVLNESTSEWRAPAYTDLTSREREVLNLLIEGNTSKKIALLLEISPKTVEAHRKQIMYKTDSDSIAELVLYAIRNKIITM